MVFISYIYNNVKCIIANFLTYFKSQPTLHGYRRNKKSYPRQQNCFSYTLLIRSYNQIALSAWLKKITRDKNVSRVLTTSCSRQTFLYYIVTIKTELRYNRAQFSVELSTWDKPL